jgi:hypothetical protein
MTQFKKPNRAASSKNTPHKKLRRKSSGEEVSLGRKLGSVLPIGPHVFS